MAMACESSRLDITRSAGREVELSGLWGEERWRAMFKLSILNVGRMTVKVLKDIEL